MEHIEIIIILTLKFTTYNKTPLLKRSKIKLKTQSKINKVSKVKSPQIIKL